MAFSLEIWAEAHVCSSCFNTSRAKTHILHHHLQKLSSSSNSSDHLLCGHMGGQRGPEQPQFLCPLPRASWKRARPSPGHGSILRPLILADVAAVLQLLSSCGMLPIFLWLHELMYSSKGVKLPLAEATQRSCWSSCALPEQDGKSLAASGQAEPLPGNLAAARPGVVGSCATFPCLGCTGPSPWMLLEMGDGK